MDEHDENQAVNQLGPKRESQAKKAFIGAPKIKEFLPFPRFSEDNLGTPDSGLLTQEDLEEVLRDPRALHFGDEDSDDNNSIGVDVDDDGFDHRRAALRNDEGVEASCFEDSRSQRIAER